MGFLRRLGFWLRGSFTCSKCGKEIHTMAFGYGRAVCPNCYGGEQPFIFYNKEFFLNRLIMRLLK